jgi:integrase
MAIAIAKHVWSMTRAPRASPRPASRTTTPPGLLSAVLRIMRDHGRDRGTLGKWSLRRAGVLAAGARALAISRTAMTDFLKRLRLDVTVHGFRSSFRDWAAETTASPNHVIEMALAHQIGDAVERSYRRGDLFDKRARFMSEWAHYCTAKRLTRQATSRRSVRGGYDGQASQQTRPDDDALRQEIS